MSASTKTTTQPKRIRKGAPATQAVPVTTKARRIRKQQPGDVPAYARLSFVKGKSTRFGWDGENWFDVPKDETGDDCGRAGLLAFQELQQHVKAHGGSNTMNRLVVEWVLQAALKERDSSEAQAFIRCVAEFAAAMMASDTGACVAWMIEQNQKLREDVRVFKAERRAAFTDRMRVAKAAKRAAREQASASGHHQKTVVAPAAVEVAV